MNGQRTLVFLLMLTIGMAACGNDDSADQAGTKPRADKPTEYCANSLAVETAPEPEIDFANLSEDQQKAEVRKYATSVIRPLAEKLVATIPAEIKSAGDVAIEAVKSLEKSGDFEASFHDPEVVKAFNELHAFDLANCGWNKLDVTATEYAFGGVPASVPAGVTSFELNIAGKEPHEMVIMRRNDGETRSFDELLAIEDQAEALKHVEFISATGGPPGSDEDLYSVADFKPGDYVMVCFIPVGSTPESLEQGPGGPAPTGPPHYTRGMKAEFKVA